MRWRDFDDLPALPDTFFQTPRRVFFIGIGGIGLSALAFALAARGHQVSGSDANDSALLQKLREKGIETVLGHDAANIEGVDAIIYGSAIPSHHVEREAARTKAVPEWHRAQLLAYFVNSAKQSIAVSGTHGKSSTSAMVAHALERIGLNPTALLGAEYPPFGANVRIGDPDLVVVEADESDGSFTLLHPSVAVITNVEAEHLENYSDSEAELWRAFGIFADNARDFVIINADDAELAAKLGEGATTFGITNSADVVASDVAVEEGATAFDVEWFGKSLGRSRLGAPGNHNISNALAALCAADAISEEWSEAALREKSAPDLRDVLEDFTGVRRRFERVGEADGILIYSDYGHHPTEVARTLETARDFLQRPIVAVFQPHRYSRTQQLGKEFGPSFEAASQVVITQLYSAFEEPIEGVSGRMVLDAVRATGKDAQWAETLEEARAIALKTAKPGDAIFCLGAGDIGALPQKMLNDLRDRASLVEES
ncbi:MAG TPA: UDP-N-acetylmuramate--L-alanine ligase [Abditibacteriaceae bacterium]|jgi:UDP-N-acetylmuramate--alanine ligase